MDRFPLLIAVFAAFLVTSACDQTPAEPGDDPLTPELTLGECAVSPTAPAYSGVDQNRPWLWPAGNSGASPVNRTAHRAFCSHVNHAAEGRGRWLSYAIYLPPGYATNTASYPVVFFLHGTNSWGGGDIVAETVDDRMRGGTLDHAIYVFANGGDPGEQEFPEIESWRDRVGPAGVPYAFESAFSELVDHVSANYRVSSDRADWGIEGFSKGGGNALRFGFTPPYRFRTIAALAPGLNWDWTPDPGDDAWDFARTYAETELAAGRPPIRLLMRVGDADQTLEWNRWFDEYLDLTRPDRGCIVSLPAQDCRGSWLDSTWTPADGDARLSPVGHDFEVVTDAQPVDHSLALIYRLRGVEIVDWHREP